MKTINTILITLALSLVFLTARATDHNVTFTFEEENFVDDIPFDTESIAAGAMALSAEYYFDDEPVIGDIPFDTGCIAANCIYKKALNVQFPLKDEADIDDIPFDTHAISKDAKYRSALDEVFYFDDEADINDRSECNYLVRPGKNICGNGQKQAGI